MWCSNTNAPLIFEKPSAEVGINLCCLCVCKSHIELWTLYLKLKQKTEVLNQSGWLLGVKPGCQLAACHCCHDQHHSAEGPCCHGDDVHLQRGTHVSESSWSYPNCKRRSVTEWVSTKQGKTSTWSAGNADVRTGSCCCLSGSTDRKLWSRQYSHLSWNIHSWSASVALHVTFVAKMENRMIRFKTINTSKQKKKWNKKNKEMSWYLQDSITKATKMDI